MNKQIEEMAKLCTYHHKGECLACANHPVDCDLMCEMFGVFANLEKEGYRKASDIFEEIEEARERWESVFGKDHFGYGGDAYGYLQTDVDHTIYELRKKYESEGEE